MTIRYEEFVYPSLKETEVAYLVEIQQIKQEMEELRILTIRAIGQASRSNRENVRLRGIEKHNQPG